MSANKDLNHSPKQRKSPRNLIVTRTNAERQEDFTARRLHEIREVIEVGSPRNEAHVAYSEQTPRNPLLTGRSSYIENTPRKLTLPSEVDSDPKSLE